MSQFLLNLPKSDQHKGGNGKLLIVGGSNLFHAASLWSAQIAAHLVDMVFYSSTSGNNELVSETKKIFRDGIVIEREKVEEYAAETEVILLGPGMTRGPAKPEQLEEILAGKVTMTKQQWQNDTYLITNYLLARFNDKKIVLDAGALQMVEPKLLTEKCILTPHQGELKLLQEKVKQTGAEKKWQQVTVLNKNIVDEVWQNGEVKAKIVGGNAGLTKGGSGDALAGLVAGLYCYNEAAVAAYWGSRIIKAASEELYQEYGPFYTTTRLVQQLPKTLWKLNHE